MIKWTKQRLEKMIADGEEENLKLDYKRAASLDATDPKKSEITKDVSSFANSAGGVVIYGIAESQDPQLPHCFDPIERSKFSKEWLEQVIQTIQPRIEGLVIHSVAISKSKNTACYVVEIPKSKTAHMARDRRYHKRHNFTTVQMEDHEIRDVMNRHQHPQIKGKIFIRKPIKPFKEGWIMVKLENIGQVMAKYYMVELQIPWDLDGFIKIDKPVIGGRDIYGDYYLVRLRDGIPEAPLFPRSSIKLERKFSTDIARIELKKHRELMPRPFVSVSVFADEMPPLYAKVDNAQAIQGWTPLRWNEPG